MNPLLLIIVPLVGAALAALWPDNRTRPWFLPAVGLAHVILTFWMFINPPAVATNAWLSFDPLARAVLPAVSLLFLVCAAYGVAYLRIRAERPNRVFVAMLLAILGLLSAGHQARHLGLLWITTEAVTLAAVPLLHFNNTPRAFEATWKYLLVGGTGIALSLLGSFCLGYASLYGGGGGDLTFTSLTAQFTSLTAQSTDLSHPWVNWVLTAWVLLLVGYGTKMGLAPMHTWKPDAYGEAPGIVGAILAGGVTTVAFTAILRVRAVVAAAGAGPIADRTLLVIGLFSMLVAALFLLGTRDFKRMLAYSSVEHMGILCIGAALGTAGAAAALFHVWSNSLTKGSLFLSAGNIRRAAGSPSMDDVRGMAVLTPRSAALFVAGMFAVTACPPFGPFFSELQVVRASLSTWHGVATAIFLTCLLLAFFGLTRVIFGIVDGRPRPATKANSKNFVETIGVLAPPFLLLGLSLWLGLFTPPILREAWQAAAIQLFPTP
jgi:hydrogenase-4 component F